MRQARSGVPICTSNTPTHQHTPISEKDGSFLLLTPGVCWCVGIPQVVVGVCDWSMLGRPVHRAGSVRRSWLVLRSVRSHTVRISHCMPSSAQLPSAARPCIHARLTHSPPQPVPPPHTTARLELAPPSRDATDSSSRNLSFAGRKDAATTFEPELQRAVRAAGETE